MCMRDDAVVGEARDPKLSPCFFAEVLFSCLSHRKAVLWLIAEYAVRS
jgi:hypothetical protein